MHSDGFCRAFNFEKKITLINLVSKKILRKEKGHIGLESIKLITECVRIFERGNKVFIIITFFKDDYYYSLSAHCSNVLRKSSEMLVKV